MNTISQFFIQNFANPAVMWFILGLLFFILEFAMPGFILFFFALGAWVVALLSLAFNPSTNIQLLIFLGTSIGTILLFRKWIKKILWTKKFAGGLEDEFLGKTGTAETHIGPGRDGKIDFKGTHWNARSADKIERGEQVTIIGNDSILLLVNAKKT
ncbi:NfeD family protein [Rhodocytophaga aerolata]|uniref:NfeD family protein n=1 Tax=Rhodocytophaga aerolata TaxID=455078 RepID=A0ABT8RGR3_9BACT|nr:NfeD family protein [Rhodocytophaga aerolata]MDO1450534.1 NfeD family protein [Rhodocytophaga aerolata]